MTGGGLDAMVGHLRTVVQTRAAPAWSDAELLGRFAALRDEAAFAALVERHGRLVLHVCRQLLGHEHDAEDAFQATFLVLAKKAGSIRKGDSVASWLYGVAYRTAMKAKTTKARERDIGVRRRSFDPTARAGRESPVTARGDESPVTEAALRELQAMLAEEVERLPDKYRAPFVLCCLEGKSRTDVAAELGWKEGTVSGRLAQARRRLQARLTRRGVTLSAGLCAMALSAPTLSASLVASSVRNAIAFATGRTADALAPAAALATNVLRGAAIAKLKLTLLLVLMATTAAVAAVLARPADADPLPNGPVAVADDPPAKPQVRPAVKDSFGDPLPDGAIARLGTARLRGFVRAFSNEGKTLITLRGQTLHYWDVATGKEQRRKQLAQFGTGVWSPDGKLMLVSDSNSIQFLETESGKELASISLAEQPQSISRRVMSNGSIAGVFFDDRGATQQGSIYACDMTTGKMQRLTDKTYLHDLAISPDGKTLAATTVEQTRIWETKTGKEILAIKARAFHIAFSPDGKTLVGIGSDRKVKLWNVETAEEKVSFQAFPREKYDERTIPQVALSFSPDGGILVLSGEGTIVLWDLVTRKELHRIAATYPGQFAFSPDGRTLAVTGFGSAYLYDVATGKLLLPRAGHDGNVYSMVFSPNGKVLAATALYVRTIHLWDPADGQLLGELHGKKEHYGAFLFSPDGRLLATEEGRKTVRLWDIKTNKQIVSLEINDKDDQKHQFDVDGLHFSNDGKLLTVLGTCRDFQRVTTFHGQLTVWETATGNLVQRRKFPGSYSLTLAPDGKTIVSNTGTVRDARTGDTILQLRGPIHLPTLFSHDGKIVAVGTYEPPPDPRMGPRGKMESLCLFEVATGRELCKLPTETVTHGDFSPDGRIVAVAGREDLTLWEVASGKRVMRLTAPEPLVDAYGPGYRMNLNRPASFASCLAFSRDGASVATGLADTTIMLWDVAPGFRRAPQPPIALGPVELDRLWSDLAGDDAAKAYRAIWTLAAAPDLAIPFLKNRLKPSGDKTQRIDKLIAELDSDNFAIRNAAFQELKNHDIEIEPALRRVLAAGPSLELRRRLEALLAQPPAIVRDREVLRGVRTIQMLEANGTAAARQLLQALAAGAAGARLTQEAKASLARLK